MKRIAASLVPQLIGSPESPPVLVFLCTRQIAEEIRKACGRFPDVAWIMLEDADNAVDHFVRRLTSALDIPWQARIDPQSFLSGEANHRPAQALLEMALNVVVERGLRRTIVLDGYEVISSAPVHELLAYLADFLPGSVRLIMLAQNTPPVGVTRLLVRDRARVYRVEG